jgi:hypothetical protein
MTTGKDIGYFFAAYTSAFLIFILYTIYLAARLAKIERKAEKMERGPSSGKSDG